MAEIQASVDYNILDLSGSPAPWPDVLAVYAVKTTSDPDNGQEVVAMDNARKVLLRRGFWEMNRISSSVTVRTYEVSSTTTDENGNTVESTDTETEVTLHITISHRTAGEMADALHFDSSQREQLDFLLSPENRSLWDALLQGAGIGAGGGNGGDLGTALTAGWSGAPALSAGVPTRAAVSAQLSRSFPGVPMEWRGSKARIAGETAGICPSQGILSFLTGTRTWCRTMWGSWRRRKVG